MLSKAKIKFIRSLGIKKNRQKEGLFVAEGPKVVGDLLRVMPASLILHTSEWNPDTPLQDTEVIEVSDTELHKVSFLQHPQQVLGLFPQRQEALNVKPDELSLALDGVQDPGNLGTILRIADWFGIYDIYCSNDTADVYNPKVVQATMGSLARVSVHYVNLSQLIQSLPSDTPVYGTFLDGDNIYNQELTPNGLIVMGNEGNGISPAIKKLINRRLLIPSYPIGRPTADSLNVAIATAIVCNEFRRSNK